ncbi:MAG: Glu/Leu/Phe/Val dehydrogenase dimerization domain-containing protein, partial [Solirubrobacteraceae bacterium]
MTTYSEAAHKAGLRLADALDGTHERVLMVNDQASGLRAVIAIHSTVLGPALGGLRIRQYAGGPPEALDDALRLSAAMTLKAAAAGLDLGGGKCVVLDDGQQEQREARLIALAGEIEALEGSYITSEDIGTTTADIDLLAQHTQHVVGRSQSLTHGVAGDPSPATAQTVFAAIRAALETLDNSDELDGRTVGVIGLGKVGGPLARMLAQAGAQVIAFDPLVNAAGFDTAIQEATLEQLFTTRMDVLAPCAVGGMIDEPVAAGLNCRIVCGAANNPLADAATAALLAQRGILYVPDFMANCGGLVHADAERRGIDDTGVSQLLKEAGQR